MAGRRLEVGTILGAHGVKGLVKVKSHTEMPDEIATLGPLTDAEGRPVALAVVGRVKGALLAEVEGVSDRDRAEALRGTRLFLERDRLPALEEPETYYHADLIGLAVEDSAGRSLGRVRALHDFGAGDVIEIAGADGRSSVLPFTRAVLPVIDLAAGRIVVESPEEIVVQPRPLAEQAGDSEEAVDER